MFSAAGTLLIGPPRTVAVWYPGQSRVYNRPAAAAPRRGSEHAPHHRPRHRRRRAAHRRGRRRRRP
ncbi:hypothetical protein N136_04714, partial [Leifsonia aquatica ATCC 14665]